MQWVFGLFIIPPLVMFVWVNFALDDRQLDPEDHAEIAALEDMLRPLGAVEDTVGRYESAMQQIADELSAGQPGLTWRWDGRASSRRCDGEFEGTGGVQMRTRQLVANQPMPDDRWAAAHQVVRDHASGIGVSYVSGYELPGGSGGAIDLTQRDVAVLSGVTPCQLRRDDIGGG